MTYKITFEFRHFKPTSISNLVILNSLYIEFNIAETPMQEAEERLREPI
jgi:hypothetical protein